MKRRILRSRKWLLHYPACETGKAEINETVIEAASQYRRRWWKIGN